MHCYSTSEPSDLEQKFAPEIQLVRRPTLLEAIDQNVASHGCSCFWTSGRVKQSVVNLQGSTLCENQNISENINTKGI